MILKDQLGQQINVIPPLTKIISVVPSHTELLVDFFGIKNLIGRTKFCIHPKEVIENVPIIGGTKQLKIDKILALKPDIIFANKEENKKQDIEVLQKQITVYISDISSLKDSYAFIKQLGKISDNHTLAETIIQQTNQTLAKHTFREKKTAAYLIWKNPYMSVGSDTYIHDIMQRLGFENIFQHKLRYPKTDIEEIKILKPDVILLSSEPYPFKQFDIQELGELFPTTTIQLVDGEFFSWYGSRILKLQSLYK